jgi:hypothetical protein
MHSKQLDVGRTYYHLTFADRDLTMPGIEPWVYIGEVELEDGRAMLAFQDTVSYVRFGSRLDLTEGNDEIEVYFIEPGALGGSILALEEVANEVSQAVKRATELGSPTLPVLKTGWSSAL